MGFERNPGWCMMLHLSEDYGEGSFQNLISYKNKNRHCNPKKKDLLLGQWEIGRGGTVSQRTSTIFLAVKKTIKFYFLPPQNKTLHLIICSVNLAFRHI
jgi:hypothetical protein